MKSTVDAQLIRHAATLESTGAQRRFRVFDRAGVEPPKMMYVDASGRRRPVTMWCSNDYLGMSYNPDVINAATETVRRCGVGAGSVRSLAGTCVEHVALEKELAAWHGKEACLLYNSAFVANESAISCVARVVENPRIFSDSLNHNSIVQGINRSKADKTIFEHNSVHSLRRALEQNSNRGTNLIVCESVYSMNGDIAPLSDYCEIAEDFDAHLYVDEVHAIGVYGHTGAGVAERDGLGDKIDVIQGTLGKAIGVLGGYVASSSAYVDWIRQKSPGFIFSTALPPGIAAAALESIRILRKADELRLRHWESVTATRDLLVNQGFNVISLSSHIIPLHVGSARQAQAIAEDLLNDFDISVQAILPPSVDVGMERLRITPTPFHTELHRADLLTALTEVWKRHVSPTFGEK